jgi:MoaA/NifB/PqqE/SkfB family radical SAM enzyme
MQSVLQLQTQTHRQMNDITGIHIEPTNICTLKCSGCARTRFIDQWPQHWKNHSLDIDQLLKFLDIDLADKRIGLCGNYGDPIYHPNFIELVNKLKARGANLTIFTNGSYKKHDWWESLVKQLTPTDVVIFSVDGTPSNFTEYRVNADWESIETGMKVVANSSCQSVWKYIPFSFNQNDIAEVEKLSNQIGIKRFWIETSDRFDDQTFSLKPDNKLLSPRYSAKENWKFNNRDTIVDPECKQGRQHFITADGYYAPCCYLADHRFYYKTQFGKNKTQYDIRQHTLTEILQQSQTVEFYQTLQQQPGCQYNCPTIKG